MKKIKIAQIGTSRYSHGAAIFNCIKSLPEIFEVAGYCLPENEREQFPDVMKAFEGYDELSLEEILENPEIEAVTVETEECNLTKYALLAAQHKKHIHMEKPGSQSLEDFEALIAEVKNNQTVFHTGYMYRYNPYIMKLMERIKAGELGEIISVEAQMNCYHQPALRQWLSKYKGGMTFFLGCHLIDLILSIQGNPDNIIPLNKCTGIVQAQGEDFGMAVFEYKKGVSFAKISAVEYGGFSRRQLVVSGTEGTIEIRPLEYDYKYPLRTSSYREIFDNSWNFDSDFLTTEGFDRYENMMKSFAGMVRGEKENPWSYDYELNLYKTILKACNIG